MDHIQTGLDLIQFIAGIGQLILHIPGQFRSILDLVHKVSHFFMQLGNLVAELGNPSQSPLRGGKQRCRAVGIVTAVEIFHRVIETVGDFFRILKQLPAGFQFLALPCFQIGFLDLPDLIL